MEGPPYRLAHRVSPYDDLEPPAVRVLIMKTNHLPPTEENGWTFHPTSLEDYLRCPRRYYYKTLLGLLPISASVDLEFGRAFHEGVGAFYANRTGEFALAKDQAILHFQTAWTDAKLEGTEKKNLGTGEAVLKVYCEVYKNDSASYKRELIECEQTIEMSNDTKLKMRLDRVLVSEPDCVCVVDTKTTGQYLSDWYWKGFANSFQLGAYDYAVSTICGHNDGVQVDAVHVPLMTKKVEEGFVRKTWQLTELQRSDWVNSYERVTGKIRENILMGKADKDALLKGFYCVGTSCSAYGGCPYLPICKHGYSHPSVKSQFIKEER